MAIGIDSAAHNGAKYEIGKTIAVLGSGFNNIYPKENIDLFYEILKEGGCIVTEYAPNEQKNSKNFPKRNRIVSGLSDGLLVVEARYRSGTSITAKLAQKQNKPVFCIPSNIDSKTGYGPGLLIQNGAKLVLTPGDILKEFGVNFLEKRNIKEHKKYIKIDNEYKEIYNIINMVPININDISRKCTKSIGEINIALTMLELQGVIKQVGVNEFIRL